MIEATSQHILSEPQIKRLKKAVKHSRNINGLTHNFYRYPARFSPEFASEVIEIFSKPGDIIFDPFLGGGTTAVEALVRSRNFIGIDVSPIATFVSKVKTSVLSPKQLNNVTSWFEKCHENKINNYDGERDFFWEAEGYFKNVPWQLKRLISIYLQNLNKLRYTKEKNLAKCILLRTAQWALDHKEVIPSTSQFRNKLSFYMKEFTNGINELRTHAVQAGSDNCCIINGKSENMLEFKEIDRLKDKVKLVITSPPYVGVQILYHQWQVNGRRRTRAPFWIVGSLDGHGSGHYTFGYYQTHAQENYFQHAQEVFSKMKSLLHREALVVQLVGFSNPKQFLPLYLKAMDAAGFVEVDIKPASNGRINRIWRDVPNRKWYHRTQDEVVATKEVLLIHKLKI